MPANEKRLQIVVTAKDLLSRGFTGMRNKITGFATGLTRSIGAATSAVFSLRGALLALGGGLAIRGLIQAGSSIEQFRIQLQALSGDAEKANATLQRMREFAAASPLATEDVIQAFVRLKAVGVKNAEDTVEALGNVALIFNRKVSDVALAFISFEREVLRRLGIEVERTGQQAFITAGEGLNRIEIATDNTADAIRGGLLQVWNKQFPDAMELAGSTFSAKMAVMKSAIFELSADIAETFFPSLKAGIDSFTDSINRSRERIVAAFASFTEITDTITNHIKEQFKEAFGTGEIGRAFGVLMGALLRLFGNTLIGMTILVAEIAKQMWKPILVELAGLGGEIQIQFASMLEATLGKISDKFVGITEATRQRIDQEMAGIANEFKIDLDEAFGEIGARNEELLVQFASDLEGVVSAAGQVGKTLDLDGLKIKIRGIVDESQAGIEKVRKDLQDLAAEMAGAAGGGGDTDGSKAGGGFFGGFKKGLDETIEKFKDFESQGKKSAVDLANGMKGAFKGFFTDVIKGTESVEDAFRKMGEKILDTIFNVVAEIIAQQIVGALFGTALRLGGAALGVPTFAKGGIAGGPVRSTLPIRQFASGGVVNEPTVAVFGEGKQREAFVPLPDGRSIPVSLMGDERPQVVLNMVIKAWDTQDVMRNRKSLSQAIMEELRRNTPLRREVQRA